MTKLAGHVLRAAGFRCWYWGMRSGGTEYMGEYEQGYGGTEIPRAEFYDLWCRLRCVRNVGWTRAALASCAEMGVVAAVDVA